MCPAMDWNAIQDVFYLGPCASWYSLQAHVDPVRIRDDGQSLSSSVLPNVLLGEPQPIHIFAPWQTVHIFSSSSLMEPGMEQKSGNTVLDVFAIILILVMNK